MAFFSGYTNFATVAQTYLENDLAAPLPENSHGPTERQHKHAESRCLSPPSSMDDRWVNGGHAARLAVGNRYRYHTEGKSTQMLLPQLAALELMQNGQPNPRCVFSAAPAGIIRQ